MTEQQEKKIREFAAYLLGKHGFERGVLDPVLPVLYIIHKENSDLLDEARKISSQLQIGYEKFNPKSYTFYDDSAAWKFSLAGTLKWLWIGLTLIIIWWSGYFWWLQRVDVKTAQLVLKTADSITLELVQRVKKDKDGYFYLEFTKPKNNSIQFFSEYSQLGDKKIRVYVGKDSGTIN